MALSFSDIKQPAIQGGGLSENIKNYGADAQGNPMSLQDYRQSTFGDNPANQYRRAFESATGTLGQGPNANPEFLKKTVDDVMDTFIEDHMKTTGQLPSKEQIGEFTSSVITPSFATKAIEMGGISKDAIRSQYVKPYFQMNDIKTGPDVGAEDALQKKYDEIYGGLGDYLQQANKRNTDEQLKQYYESRAALGGLRDPASIVGETDIRGKSANALGLSQAQLASTRGQGQAGLSQAIAQIGESGRQANMTQGLNVRKQQGAEDEAYNMRNIGERQLGIASDVGKRRANANKPGTLDYINTGVNVLKALT